ncbi:acyl-CoA carboxylase subunit epsilon (plasmid) [Streptomyces sp. NBC_01260]|uniref:acyl-CoA carboxylase subunit epsilon n=1 Tax=unclassified Streptomyces TaxID=2593676 RepID=UPI000F48D597|nr:MULTISPECIES: acyl-CoA carboxylase subunit epsilon [unclassified Streptomyces]MCX4775194.1 acyl-CoA carboxylase subunit epsilon [Streptomyces sp. NBC_01285]ROQ65391.1 acyl-CoA carboxylase epsilon subunit-like protein [Streptomyces sp. CEV 2-1]RPK32953.1 hypothetical protein EES39_37920 [Streptomyces sp. ADI92-24]
MPETTPLMVLRGNPTPEELAGLLTVLAALRGTSGEPDSPATERRWGRRAGWPHPPAVAPDAAGWQRTPTHERTIR